jgi:hypothetical protein
MRTVTEDRTRAAARYAFYLKKKGFRSPVGVMLIRFYAGNLAITLISKSKPDSQVTPMAVTVE